MNNIHNKIIERAKKPGITVLSGKVLSINHIHFKSLMKFLWPFEVHVDNKLIHYSELNEQINEFLETRKHNHKFIITQNIELIYGLGKGAEEKENFEYIRVEDYKFVVYTPELLECASDWGSEVR